MTDVPCRLPLVGHALQAAWRPLRFLESLSRHGDIVRLSAGRRDIYIVTHPELVHRMLATESRKLIQSRLIKELKVILPLGLLILDGATHRRERRYVQPAFHRQAVDGYVGAMQRLTGEYVKKWEADGQVDMSEELGRLLAAATTEQLFSVSIEDARRQEILHLFSATIDAIGIRSLLPGWMNTMPMLGGARHAANLSRVREVAAEILSSAREAGSSRSELLDAVFSAHSGDERHNAIEATCDHVIMLLAGGFGTVPVMAAWALYEIARDSAVRQRLHEELDAVLGDRPVDSAIIPHLQYTSAVVAETLRLHGIPIILREVAAPIRLGRGVIPEGADIGCSPYALQRDPRFYEDPACFRPARWYPASRETVNKKLFLTFGAGPHKCIGESLALSNLITIVATVCNALEFAPVPGYPVRERLSMATVKPNRLLLRITPRQRTSAYASRNE